jgi:1-acyl-sn-glycerol-3-phosphate acyltransferase
MTYALLRALMRTITRIYLVGLFQVEGVENVPRTGPLIVCPNHSGTIDPPLVPAFLPRSDTWSMAKSEFFTNPFARRLFSMYHAFPVVRHSADRTALRRSFDLLKAGHVLIMYPEGRRVDAGGLAVAEPGAGFIAQRAGCPVLPVALTGTAECLPKGARWPRRVPVTLRFGRPFHVRSVRPDGRRVTHQEGSEAIMLAIAELLPPEQRGAFGDLEGIRERASGVYEPVTTPGRGSGEAP